MLKRISSAGTFFFKFVVPGTIISLFSLGLILSLTKNIGFAILALCGLAAEIFSERATFMRLKVVIVNDTNLYVSNYFKRITIPLNEVAYIEKSDWGKGYVVWIIHFTHDTEFGREIIFSPIPDHTLPDRGNAEDLIKNIPARWVLPKLNGNWSGRA